MSFIRKLCPEGLSSVKAKFWKGEIYQSERYGFAGPEQFKANEEMKELRDTVDKDSHTWLLPFPQLRSIYIIY
jgi:hypothetical protein